MQLHEIKAKRDQLEQSMINIMSDGYDYFVRIHEQQQTSFLTDKKGRRKIFKNLGDAEQILRQIGIHQATLSQIIPHDETIASNMMSGASQESQMPLSF